MAHCLSEAAPENIRWVSSQVAGDSTAQTVTIRSIGFMPHILCVEADIPQIETAMMGAKFQIPEKSASEYRPRSRWTWIKS
jgi:hypothetical protein